VPNCLMTSTCVLQRNAALVFSQSSLPSAGNKGDAPPPVDAPLSSERETPDLWFAAAPFGCVEETPVPPVGNLQPGSTSQPGKAAPVIHLCYGPARWRSWLPERQLSLVFEVANGHIFRLISFLGPTLALLPGVW